MLGWTVANRCAADARKSEVVGLSLMICRRMSAAADVALAKKGAPEVTVGPCGGSLEGSVQYTRKHGSAKGGVLQSGISSLWTPRSLAKSCTLSEDCSGILGVGTVQRPAFASLRRAASVFADFSKASLC